MNIYQCIIFSVSVLIIRFSLSLFLCNIPTRLPCIYSPVATIRVIIERVRQEYNSNNYRKINKLYITISSGIRNTNEHKPIHRLRWPPLLTMMMMMMNSISSKAAGTLTIRILLVRELWLHHTGAYNAHEVTPLEQVNDVTTGTATSPNSTHKRGSDESTELGNISVKQSPPFYISHLCCFGSDFSSDCSALDTASTPTVHHGYDGQRTAEQHSSQHCGIFSQSSCTHSNHVCVFISTWIALFFSIDIDGGREEWGTELMAQMRIVADVDVDDDYNDDSSEGDLQSIATFPNSLYQHTPRDSDEHKSKKKPFCDYYYFYCYYFMARFTISIFLLSCFCSRFCLMAAKDKSHWKKKVTFRKWHQQMIICGRQIVNTINVYNRNRERIAFMHMP